MTAYVWLHAQRGPPGAVRAGTAYMRRSGVSAAGHE